MRRRAARIDANQPVIVEAARQLGATVWITADLGNGGPDLVIGWRGLNYLVEVKDAAKPPSARKLTSAEREFHDQWRGQVVVVESVDDLVRLIQGAQ